MMFGLLKKRGSDRAGPAETVHAAIVAASRRRELYAGLGAPDTTPGRFELLVLHAALYMRRLRRDGDAKAGQFAQEVFDVMFRTLDDNLREIGIGDATVPKRVKAMARSFYDGAAVYDAALDARDQARLARDLDHIVYRGAPADPGHPERLAYYAVRADAALATQPLQALMTRGPGFPPVGEDAP